MDIAQFRKDFPEFNDSARFPNQQLEFWGDLASNLLSVDRLGDVYTKVLGLFVAHNVALSAQSREASSNGGVPGVSSGLVSSKAVGSVNVSYDTSIAMEPNAGHWNQTTYGRQYINLVRLLGAGCYQL